MRRVNLARVGISLAFLNFLSFPALSGAAVIRVPGDYSTIQAAIDAAQDGDEVVVSPGTYYENIHFKGKNFVLQSTEPTNPTIVHGTIIDGFLNNSVVGFAGTEGPTSVLKGFTITNGLAPIGGGIRGNGTKATLEFNRIVSNYAFGIIGLGFGGGLYGCDGVIQFNEISKNVTDVDAAGGGLHACNGTIQFNTIMENEIGLAYCNGIIRGNTIAKQRYGLWRCGGVIENNDISHNAVYGVFECDGTIRANGIESNERAGVNWCDGLISGNFIFDNRTYGLYECSGPIERNIVLYNYSDGLWGCNGPIVSNMIAKNGGNGLARCQGSILNNTIYANKAEGIYDCLSATIRNCIIWKNRSDAGIQINFTSTPTYSCIQNWDGSGIGNIATDPQVVDAATDDYHLLPTSPCIDAGGLVAGLTGDFEGDFRPFDGVSQARGDGSDFDIGADEYVVSSGMTNSWYLY